MGPIVLIWYEATTANKELNAGEAEPVKKHFQGTGSECQKVLSKFYSSHH